MGETRSQPSEAFEALVDSIEDYAVVLLDADGVIRSWNSGAERIEHYESAEIIGRHFSCLYSEDDIVHGIPERELKEARRIGRVKVTGQRVRKDRSSFLADVVITALTDRSGALNGFGQVISDVTGRAEAEHRFRNAMEFSPIGLGLVSLDGKWLTANRALCTMLGRSEDEFREITIRELTIDQNSAQHYELISDLLQDKIKSYQIERELIRKDGSLVWALLSVSLVRDERGVPQCFIGQAQDITQRRTIETELSLASERMLEAKQAAETANNAKTDFLTTMSHELRTPMNGILGFAQLLEAPIFGTLTVKQGEFVQAILRSGRHLLDLINDILELSKIEAGKLTVSVERVELLPVMKSVASALANMAQASDVALGEDRFDTELPAVLTDRVRLIQCLINLGSNAIKYNRPRGRVDFSYERLDEARLRIRVTDTGIGIPEARQHELFQPFNRLGAAQLAIEGTGVGLALTRRLVEAMGGSVGFTSVQNVGSSFWIDLPVYARGKGAPGMEDGGQAGWTPGLGDFTLLYAEDNPSNMDLMRSIMETVDGVQLIEAVSGAQAIALAKQHRPDVVILDLNLPDISGYDVLQVLRSRPDFAATQFIALSASVMPSDLKRGLQAGFSRYLMMPLDIGLLMISIEEALAATRAATRQ